VVVGSVRGLESLSHGSFEVCMELFEELVRAGNEDACIGHLLKHVGSVRLGKEAY
jgi:hypothetical protein